MRTMPPQAAIDWIRGHGIDPNVIPEDALNVYPDGAGATVIEWAEYARGDDGEFLLNDAGDDFVETDVLTKRVQDRPPYWVRDGVAWLNQDALPSAIDKDTMR